MSDFKQCLKEYLVNFIVECPDTCFVKEEDKTVISIPFDAFFEKITEKLRTDVLNTIESDEFAESLKEKLGNSNSSIVRKIEDTSGLVIAIKN